MKYTDTECPACGETPESGVSCTTRIMETTAGVFPRVKVYGGFCGVCGAPESGTHHIDCLNEPCAACYWTRADGPCDHEAWFLVTTAEKKQ